MKRRNRACAALWKPQPGPQLDAIESDWCGELFFGGAAGGGKSDFLLGDYLQDVPTYGARWPGVLFRRTYPELEELISRSREIYPATGAKWSEGRRTWTWPNGASLKLRYLESDADCTRYQGHQYAWIGFDELTQWRTLYPYRYLRGRLRSAHPVPTKRIRAAGNPGGPGHVEVRRYFVDPAPGGYELVRDEETGLERLFIPARLKDNAILTANDPSYAARLAALGGQLARAMLEGDWSIIEGAFFDNWSNARNIVRPFALAPDWTRFRSLDWGSAPPFSVGWWAVAGEACEAEGLGGAAVAIPRGALVRYREWYGGTGKPNEGVKMTAERVAEGVKDREAGEAIAYGVADPAIFASDGGPSIAERMYQAGLAWRRADNARVARSGALGGWDEMRARISGDETGPRLVVFSTCKDFIRTVPALQHDPARLEDIDTDAEDHAADEARYACMSRPYARTRIPAPAPKAIAGLTFDQVLRWHERKRETWV
jgi:hypothetical protein